jgi:hypothetical protein
MKKSLLAVFLFPAMTGSAWCETIPARDAPDYYGQSVTVVGRANVQRMGSGEIYLDLGGSGDGAPVTAYVSRWNAGQFFDIGRLDGKLVAVSGDIGSFRYRPEIFVTDPGQIAMVKAPVTPQMAPETKPRPRWIHIDSKQMQHRQNQDRP